MTVTMASEEVKGTHSRTGERNREKEQGMEERTK